MDVCIFRDCRAPIIHGVPLCHHNQDPLEQLGEVARDELLDLH